MTGISQVYNIKNSAQKSYVEPFPSNKIVAEDISKHHIADYSIEYQICLDDAVPDSIKKDNDVMMSCPDRICSECGNDHSFRGNFEDAITIIDVLPELFPEVFKNSNSSSISINKLQEFVN